MTIIRSSSRADAQAIHDRLYAFNCAKTGDVPEAILLPDDPSRRTLLLVEPGHVETPSAGLVYRIAGERLEVDFLFVAEACRGQRAGARLIEAVKAEAALAGCVAITLFTFGFQAPDFYPKLGFTLARVDKRGASDGSDTYHYRLDLGGSPPPDCPS